MEIIEFCFNTIDPHASYISYVDERWENANFGLSPEEYECLSPLLLEVSKVLKARIG